MGGCWTFRSTYLSTYIHTCMHTYIHMYKMTPWRPAYRRIRYACVYVCIYIYKDIFTHTHTHIPTCIYMHIHTQGVPLRCIFVCTHVRTYAVCVCTYVKYDFCKVMQGWPLAKLPLTATETVPATLLKMRHSSPWAREHTGRSGWECLEWMFDLPSRLKLQERDSFSPSHYRVHCYTPGVLETYFISRRPDRYPKNPGYCYSP